MQKAIRLLASARFVAPVAWTSAVLRIHAETGLDFARARARAGFSRGHLLDVVVSLPGGHGVASEVDAAEELVRLLVGEEVFERWVGKVSVTPAARGGPLKVLNAPTEEQNALPIEQLLESVRAAIAGLRASLPPLPPQPGADDWFAFELSPDPASDYTAQDDLVFCSRSIQGGLAVRARCSPT